ncbi:MAG TPA: NB-ARC domain-containing protein, partial [Myxococcota bacterium]|nr:NB-ARC domain-containing protein [Myxococcota bacterium]
MQEALQFGRALLAALTRDTAIATRWAALSLQRGTRPLCLDLIFPPRTSALARLPFELLADEQGFLFRRPGSSVIRRLEGLEPQTEPVRGGAALFAWANPSVLQNGVYRTLPDSLLRNHEAEFDAGARLAGLAPRPPLRGATWSGLRAALRQPTPLFGLLAHGLESGEAVLLQNANGDGVPLPAADLALVLRAAHTRIAMLWSCHAAEQDPDFGGVVQQLLEQGGLTAVLASHAAVLADRTPALARALLQALGGIAGGDFERALTEARSALSQDDLQWAVPTCYAPPRAGSGIFFTIPQDSIDTSIPSSRTILQAPGLAPHFLGRETETTTTLDLLRNHRLISLEGMPGIGKTELARQVIERASQEQGFARIAWISLSGHQSLEALQTELALLADLDQWAPAPVYRWLKTSPTLLVLDNAEDLIRPKAEAFSEFVGTLLRTCPTLRLLLTTQVPLPDPDGFLGHHRALDRLLPPFDRQLFVETAGARLTTADLADPELPARLELRRLLDGVGVD